MEEKSRNLANINTIILSSKEKKKHEYGYITIMVMPGTSEYRTVEELTERICQYLYKMNKTVWLRHFYNAEDYFYTIFLKERDFNIIYDLIKENMMVEKMFKEIGDVKDNITSDE